MKTHYSISRWIAGLLLSLTVVPAFAATVIVDDLFDGSAATYPVGSAPPGWEEAIRDTDPARSVLSRQDGFLKMQILSPYMVPMIMRSLYTDPDDNPGFDPTGMTVTMETNIHTLTGDRDTTGFGTSTGVLNWTLSGSGVFKVSSAWGACGPPPSPCTYTLPTLLTIPNPIEGEDPIPYGGNDIAVTMTANALGWRLTTPVLQGGYDSGLQPYSLLDPVLLRVSFANVSNAGSQILLGVAGANTLTNYGSIRVYTAAPGDVTTISTSTTQSTDVATTTYSVTSGGSLNQTGGVTKVLETMTVGGAGGGTYTLAGGKLDATTIDIASGGALNFTGGTLSVDSLQGSLTNLGGTLSPGDSPGGTLITGDYDQQSAGTLLIEIAGLNPATQFDQVQVTGTATLGGTLDVDLLYGYNPTLGSSYDILLAEVVSGTFGSTLLPTLTAGLMWNLQYLLDANGTTDIVRLSVEQAVPVPAAAWLLSSALAGLGWVRRKQNKG